MKLIRKNKNKKFFSEMDDFSLLNKKNIYIIFA